MMIIQKNNVSLFVAMLIIAVSQGAAAADVKISGFVNGIGAVTDTPKPYLNGNIDNRGSYEESSIGINISSNVGEGLSLAAQLATHAFDNDIVFDWGFGSYEVNDTTSVRAGRLKYNGNLVSEYKFVGYAYPWIRPPEVVYEAVMSTPTMGLATVDGMAIDINGETDAMEYSFTAYVGGMSDKDRMAGMTMDFDKMIGASFRASNEVVSGLISYNHSIMDTDMGGMDDEPMSIISAGGTMEWNNILAWAEYSQSQSDFILMGNKHTLVIDAWYATLGYRFGKLMPHITYQSMNLENDNGDGALEQESTTVGLRYELTNSASVKVEWASIDPTAAPAAATIPMMYKTMMGATDAGLFADGPESDKVDMFSVAVNYVF